MGLTVGAVQSDMTPAQARAAYACDVTYVTGQQLCFNYLNDHTARSVGELVRTWDMRACVWEGGKRGRTRRPTDGGAAPRQTPLLQPPTPNHQPSPPPTNKPTANHRSTANTQMLPERLNFAIVDEADSILIDESRNPMILSQPLYDTAPYVAVVDRVRTAGLSLLDCFIWTAFVGPRDRLIAALPDCLRARA